MKASRRSFLSGIAKLVTGAAIAPAALAQAPKQMLTSRAISATAASITGYSIVGEQGPEHLVFGRVMNVKPTLANASTLSYTLGRDATITQVYDAGVKLAKVDRDPGAGEWAPIDGAAVLGSAPAGIITVDAQGPDFRQPVEFSPDEVAGSAVAARDEAEGKKPVTRQISAMGDTAQKRERGDMAERENGFYWVKNGLDWVVAEWFGDQWFMAGSEVDEPSGAFAQVGPRLTPPGEPDPIHVLFRRLVFECDFVDTTGHMDKILAEAKKLGFDGKRP